jgi:hypothetical protein
MPDRTQRSTSSATRALAHLRTTALVVLLLAGAGFFASYVDRFYAVKDWLFWRYAAYWVLTFGWLLACLSLGHAFVTRAFRGSFNILERLTLALPVGVYAFHAAIFLLGLVGELGPPIFWLLPAVFLAAGARGLVRDVARYHRRTRPWNLVGLRTAALPLLAVGAVGVGVLYFQNIVPDQMSFDSRWYHLPIAQKYAITGRIARFEEGFWQGAYPQLSTHLFTWAFLMPGDVLFDRAALCGHLEFGLFLATLAQIPVFVRRLVPRSRPALAWVSVFLFPGIYLYDSNLHTGADHIAGFWAIPLAFAAFRAWSNFTVAKVFLFSLFAAGAMQTKYTAVILVAPFALAMVVRALWVTMRVRTLPVFAALGVLAVAPLVLTAPHWLKNFVWYGDPFYPVLHAHLRVRPWNPDAIHQLNQLEQVARPGSLTADGIIEALKATLTFSFVPNDWALFHRDVPLFGSVFTLTLPCLLFMRGAWRFLWVHASVMLGLFVWFILSHYDRFLQALLPLMAAATAASIISLWRLGWPVRVALLPLVLLQVVWGADVPFFRTHNLLYDSPVRHTAQFLASGFENRPNRLRLFEPLPSIGAAFPRNATVLTHDIVMILGLDRNWVTDLHQSRISYARLRSPKRIHAELQQLGVTHLVWSDWSISRDSLAGDLAFLNFAGRYARDQRRVDRTTVARMPDVPPDDARKDYEVAHFGCGYPYARGSYRLSQLALPVLHAGRRPNPLRPIVSAEEAQKTADFIVTDNRCDTGMIINPAFRLMSTRVESSLFIRVAPAQ